MKKRWLLCVMMVTLFGLCAGCGSEKKTPKEENGLTPGVEEITQGGEEQPPEQKAGYSEAPLLQAMVSSNLLPVLESRLPKEGNIVVAELGSVGNYGEDLQFAAENADTMTGELVSEGLFCYDGAGNVVPNIAKGYTVNVDYTQYTIQLREGMRWSDGVPFTADDCLFFYEKMCLPEVFGEYLWQCFLVYDEEGMPLKASFQKIDDYHFMITFPFSKPEFMTQLLAQGGICFAPEHYYVNLLPEYMGEDAAKAKAKDMGYSDVTSMLNAIVMKAWNIPGLPTLNSYCISEEEGKKDVTGEYYEFVRNPYYWKVDGTGQQLPYMDRLGFTRISSETQKMMLTTEGFLSVSTLTPEQVAEAEAGKARGGYRIIRWSNFSSFAVKNALRNFPETAPYEEKVRGIGSAHVESWYME